MSTSSEVTCPAKKVVVVGLGYVGLPLAIRAVSAGYDVVGYDVDEVRIKLLQSGESFIEDIEGDEVASALSSGNFMVTASALDSSGFDYAVITVPTPLREGVPDLSFIEDAASELSRHLTKGATVILESTTYPGTTEELLVPTLERGSGLKAGSHFHVGYSPERIDPGNPNWRFTNTPKVVSGIDAPSLDIVDAFYSSLVQVTVPVSSTRVAEMSKLLENTFRHVNIALVNELSMFASHLGVSVWEAIDAASTKPFGFMRFTPGPGVGGHCLPIDPSYLSWKVKQTSGELFRFVELANDVNEHMPSYVTNRVIRLLNREKRAVNGAKILVLGLAYKKNTSDLRESPSLVICESLSKLGADIRVVDKWISADQVTPWRQVEFTRHEIEISDLVLITTDHDDVDYGLVSNYAKLVFDTRRRTVLGLNVEHL